MWVLVLTMGSGFFLTVPVQFPSAESCDKAGREFVRKETFAGRTYSCLEVPAKKEAKGGKNRFEEAGKRAVEQMGKP